MGPDIEYAANPALTDLLDSVTRPGDFCVHGRMFLPMPTVDVDGVGLLSFPGHGRVIGQRAEIGTADASLVASVGLVLAAWLLHHEFS